MPVALESLAFVMERGKQIFFSDLYKKIYFYKALMKYLLSGEFWENIKVTSLECLIDKGFAHSW